MLKSQFFKLLSELLNSDKINQVHDYTNHIMHVNLSTSFCIRCLLAQQLDVNNDITRFLMSGVLNDVKVTRPFKQSECTSLKLLHNTAALQWSLTTV